jgi:predicted lipoprotein
MKNKIGKTVFIALGCAFVLSLNSCKPKPDEDPTNNDALFLEIATDYTNNTVIKTYSLLSDKAIELLKACEQLQSSKSDANVVIATQKWIEARKYWEMSEAFLFGPAEYMALDPHIDSWPLDKNELDQILQKIKNLSVNVDAAYVRGNYGENLIGFHALEYVLFEDGSPKSISKIKDEELVYLVAVADVLQGDCIRLEAAWNENISAAKKAILADAELEVSYNYGREMTLAGSAGSRFTSPQQVLLEIISGCETIADEVGNEKIADPYESKNVLRVESWYSWNSLTDFTDNIRSIENSYLGGMDGFRNGKSLSQYVQANNPQLDVQIKSAIKDAIDKIQAIPAPFRNQLSNPSSSQAIEDAMDACNNLMNQISLLNNTIK